MKSDDAFAVFGKMKIKRYKKDISRRQKLRKNNYLCKLNN